MAVYYKFKSAKDYDSVSIDGHFISVGNLKENIVAKKNMDRGLDFDLLISNAQTNEEYSDDAQFIPKNTSVLVRRVPSRRQRPIVAEIRDEKSKEENSKVPSMTKNEIQMPLMSQQKQLEESERADEFGVDLYAVPETQHFKHHNPQQSQQVQHQLLTDKTEEDNKIKAFVDASAFEWQRQTQQVYSGGRGFGRGSYGRIAGGRGYGQGAGMEKKNPPPGYVCHRCGIAGHYIQHCPTNGDPAYDMKKMRPPTGIPKSMLVPNQDGSYTLPSGAVAALRPNEAAFEKEVEGLSSNRSVEIPPELRCPLCSAVLKDAVLTSKCCFKSYCDKCIRDQILSSGKCVCGAMNVLADDLLPNKTLRDAIDAWLLESSVEHAGSFQQSHEIKPTQVKPMAPSPSGSALEQKLNIAFRPPQNGTKCQIVANSAVITPQQTKQSVSVSLGHKEHTSESNGRQESGSPSTHIEEEVQQQTLPDASKKRKHKMKRQRPPGCEKELFHGAAGAYDPPFDGSMMPYHSNSALYGGCWGAPYMLDGCGFPLGNHLYSYGGIPGPISYEMPYVGGMMLPEHHMNHPSFMPQFPYRRDGNGAANRGSGVMSREEFEARKSELKRKRELEQRAAQHRKELGSGDPGSSRMKKVIDYGLKTMPSSTDDLSINVEEKHNKIAPLSPQAIKRLRHERTHETTYFDIRAKRNNEVHQSLDTDDRSERRPKGSDRYCNGSRNGHNSERNSVVEKDVRKSYHKEDRSRQSNRPKNKVLDEAYSSDDGYEYKIIHKVSGQNSFHGTNSRTSKGSK